MNINLKGKPFCLSEEDCRWVEETFGGMTHEERIGQLFCPIGFTDDEGFLKNLLDKYHIGGMLYREGPGADAQRKHRFLQNNSKIPLLLAANLETGGDGIATDGTSYGEQMQVAATTDALNAYRLGKTGASEGAAVGLNWAFGPIVDIDMNFRNPITNVRTFGADPETVLKMALEVQRATHEEGMATAVKHFPGDGADERDQHLVTSVNSLSAEDWEKTFGKIYKGMIEGGALSIMAGHITLPAFQPTEHELPATLSKELLQGLLRGKLGFNGLVITDATPMVGFCCAMERRLAVPASIEAGCDMFLFNKDFEEDFGFMLEGYEKGILSEKRLNEAVVRILAMKAALKLHDKQKSGTLVPGPEALEILSCPLHVQWAKECADQSVTLVRDKEGLLPLNPVKHKKVLLEILGDFPSNARVLETVRSRLVKEGFGVTVYEPENFMTLDNNTTRFRQKYDLVLYISNIENVSNKTVSRISWHTFFGNGNNVPWFTKEVPTVFVSVGNPYHLLDVPMIGTFVNAYFNSDIVLDAVADKLLGYSSFKGVSPVDAACGRKDL